jgi:Uma2 family endonuclease
MVARTQPATLADLDATPDDGQIYELLDGEIIVSAAPTWKHQIVSQMLNRLIDGWVVQNETGIALTAPVDIVLNEADALQPDLIYVGPDNSGQVLNGRFHGAPDLAVEIISPTSRSRDATVKSMRYAKAGIREFWLADPDLRTITVFVPRGDLYLEQAPEPDGTIVSTVLAGLRVDPVAVYRQIDRAIDRRRAARLD